MFSRILRFIGRLLLMLGIPGLAALLTARLLTGIYADSRHYTLETAQPAPAAIVFGAGLRRDGSPTAILRDRVETAAALYFSGKVEKILMSGDNRFVEYNEPEAMRQYALALGVPDGDIVLDYAGRRTYDTCYRAHAIFGLDRAIVVTQGFHLPRALYLCNSLGVQAAGVEAANNYYLKRSRLIWNMRELIATLAAVVDVHITRPLPVLGDPEPIFARQPD